MIRDSHIANEGASDGASDGVNEGVNKKGADCPFFFVLYRVSCIEINAFTLSCVAHELTVPNNQTYGSG